MRLKRGKSLRVTNQKIQSQFGIRGIILGAAGFEGLPVLGQRQRVDREEDEEVVLLKRIDDRPLGQLKSNGDGPTKALQQGFRPFIDAPDLVGNATEFALLFTGGLKTDVVFGVRPVDANIGRKSLRV